MDLLSSLRKALKIGQSLVAVETRDVEFFVRLFAQHMPESVTAPGSTPHKKGRAVPVRLATWDIVRGFKEVKSHGANMKLGGDAPEEALIGDVLDGLVSKGKSGDIVICMDPRLGLKAPDLIQKLRFFRGREGMIVMAGHVHDVLKSHHMEDFFLMLNEDPFDLGQARCVAESYCEDMNVEGAERAAPTLVGMNPDRAMSALEMATWAGDGRLELDMFQLKDAHRNRIDASPGLKMMEETSGFSSLVGFDRLRHLCSVVFEGKDAPGAVVWLDELEKQLGGHKSDSSGVSQDQLGTMLGWMEDHSADGVILVGHSGTAKSHFAKCLASEFEVDGVKLDLGAMRGNLVGQSENQIRDAMSAIESLSEKTFWVATSNWLENVPPELRRRFSLGTWFVDMPTDEERKAIWAMHCSSRGLSAIDVPEKLMKRNLTGAEIRKVCDLTYRGDIDFEDAASFIVPIAEGTGGEDITRLRSLAVGNYLSVSSGEKYQGVS